MVIHEAFHDLNISENDYVKLTFPDYDPFRNKETQKLLLCEATSNEGSIMTNAKAKTAWDAFVKKPAEIGSLFLEEILFQLEELIF